MTALPPHEPVPDLEALGIVAFTTTRAAGSYSLSGDDRVGETIPRWEALAEIASPVAHRLASLRQVHGSSVIVHTEGWRGWLRVPDADGHVSRVPGTAMTVSVADCIPVFIAHPSGAVGLVHSGWRGTAARVLDQAIARMRILGCEAPDLTMHLGPAICGRCYEVSPDVFARLTGRSVDRPATVDLRALVAGQAAEAGVRRISVSDRCSRCDNDRFYSHRAGDAGRQLGVIVVPSG